MSRPAQYVWRKEFPDSEVLLTNYSNSHLIFNGCIAADWNKVTMLDSICKTPLVIGEHLWYCTKGNQTAPNMFKMPIICPLHLASWSNQGQRLRGASEGQVTKRTKRKAQVISLGQQPTKIEDVPFRYLVLTYAFTQPAYWSIQSKSQRLCDCVVSNFFWNGV